MIRVVLDTNVLASGALTPAGPSSAILELADRGLIQLWISPALFDEYTELLRRLKVGVLPGRSMGMLNGLQRIGYFVTPTSKVIVSPDPDYNLVMQSRHRHSAKWAWW